MIKVDKSVVADFLQILLTGSKEEKVMVAALTALVKSSATKAIQSFVGHYLQTNKDNVNKFINACEMFDLPEEACVALLKLKGIEDIESDDDSKTEDIEEDIMKTLKAIIGD